MKNFPTCKKLILVNLIHMQYCIGGKKELILTYQVHVNFF